MIVIQPVELAVTNAGAGNATRFDLSKIPTKIGASNVAVLGLLLQTPTASFTLAAGKTVDGVSLSQLLSNVRLSLSPMSPPAAVEGGAILIDSLPGHDVLQVLGLVSGQEVIAHGIEQHVFDTATGSGKTDPDKGAWAAKVKRQVGWLQNIGPFGEGAPDTGSTWASRVIFSLPIGIDRGPIGSAAIPADWFRSGGLSGELSVTLGSTVDGAAVAYSGTFDLYAICLLTGDVMTVPAVPRLRKYTTTNASVRVQQSGHVHVIGFSPPLSAVGAMADPNYSNVELRIADTIVNTPGQLSLAIRGMNVAIMDRRFSIAAVNEDITGIAAATRYSRPFLPLLIHDFPQPPRLDDFSVNIVTSAEQTHYLLVAGRTPVTDAVKSAVRNDKPVIAIETKGCHCVAR